MKATYSQIEKALTNNFNFDVDGSRFLYEAIRTVYDDAVITSSIKKSSDHFSKKDWIKVYAEIKKLIGKYEE